MIIIDDILIKNNKIYIMSRISRSEIYDDNEQKTKSLIGSIFSGISNKKSLQIPNVYLIDTSQYKKQQICQVCFVNFTKLKRQHHCRKCANAVCGNCSQSTLNSQRCCDICIYLIQNKSQQTAKKNILGELHGAAQLFNSTKIALQQQVKRINKSLEDGNSQKNIKQSQKKIFQLQKQLNTLKFTKKFYQDQIEKIKV